MEISLIVTSVILIVVMGIDIAEKRKQYLKKNFMNGKNGKTHFSNK